MDEQGESLFRTYSDKNISKLISCLQVDDWSEVLSDKDVNIASEIFTNRMEVLVDKNFPVKKNDENV